MFPPLNFEKETERFSIESPLFGTVCIVCDVHSSGAIDKLSEAIQFLEKGRDRLTDSQKRVFGAIEEISIEESTKLGRRLAEIEKDHGAIKINPKYMAKPHHGDLRWLICHVAYRLWSQQPPSKEDNPSLFAGQIKIAMERDLSVH
jgi:hypothetical protein